MCCCVVVRAMATLSSDLYDTCAYRGPIMGIEGKKVRWFNLLLSSVE